MQSNDLTTISNDTNNNGIHVKRSTYCEFLCFRQAIYNPFLNFLNIIICFDILLLTMAFILSFGNILSKDPYMSEIYRIPFHCIIYFLLGFLLSYMCFKKVRKTGQFHRQFFIVCIIVLLTFSFFFCQLTYNDQNLNLFIRIILSTGSSLFFVSIYALHVYYDNESHTD